MNKIKSNNDFQCHFVQVPCVTEIPLVSVKGDHASMVWFENIFAFF